MPKKGGKDTKTEAKASRRTRSQAKIGESEREEPGPSEEKKAKVDSPEEQEVENVFGVTSEAQEHLNQQNHAQDQEDDTTEGLKAKIVKLELELQKAEKSKRVLYKALVRERNMNGEKPSVLMAEATKSGHNFCKPFSALSSDQKHDRIRLLVGVVNEFADPKGTCEDRKGEVQALMEELQSHFDTDEHAFQ
ncbi:unnamed protein product [Bursaphelenchus xylophilus]|uniref:(pine wood nematode) hypothetical protein n=1 Tax=Bursaphelenchus xylophilus TaxID=6326 RepID=A0A1I7RSQ3_BURXY|nr:unnamed protein product [Bursaphelenchus xylophilus]CAG9122839.1 unnamed protein product [Bursaphelenchus xylophilus]